MNLINNIRLGLFAAASVGFGALALPACQLHAALDAEGSSAADVVLEDAEQAPLEDAAATDATADPLADASAGGMVREMTVRPQDTLWSIAAAAMPPNYANVQQYMLAILQENPHAFTNGNINGLIAGSRLRLPRGDVETLPDVAIQEAVRQNSVWSGVGDDELKILVRKDNWAVSDADGQQTVAAAPAAPAESPVGTLGKTAVAAVADQVDEDAEVDVHELALPSPAPEADSSEALDEAPRQEVAGQEVQLRQRDDEIAELKEGVASLQATMQAERRDRQEERRDLRRQLALWRVVAALGAAAVVLLIVVLVMRRRHRAASGSGSQTDLPPPSLDSSPDPASPQQDEHHFGEPIGDQRVKLNLAQANMDLGKLEVAREILEEVQAEGSDAERQEAEALLDRLDAAQS